MRRTAILLLLLSASACSTYTGVGVSADFTQARADPGWTLLEGLPERHQQATWDCGIAVWRMVVEYWDVTPDPVLISEMLAPIATDQRPIRAAELRDLAIDHGLLAFVVEGHRVDLNKHLARGRPVIVGMIKPTLGGSNAHYEVVLGIHPVREVIMTFDPSLGYREISFVGFDQEWRASGSVALVILPQPSNAFASETQPSQQASIQ
jgi:ABC-type bacteriocin/lantibiotic exporter with double-glycine peptidase domain